MNIIRIILIIVTLVIMIACLCRVVFALTIPHFGMAVVCLALAVSFGFFAYRDYQYFFGAKSNDNTK